MITQQQTIGRAVMALAGLLLLTVRGTCFADSASEVIDGGKVKVAGGGERPPSRL
jgi:hypothetical protein